MQQSPLEETVALYRGIIEDPKGKQYYGTVLGGESIGTILLEVINKGDLRTFEKLMFSRSSLPASKQAKLVMQRNLAEHYGLAFKEPTADDTNRQWLDTISLRITINDCISAEVAGLEPREILKREQEVRNYMIEKFGPPMSWPHDEKPKEYTTDLILEFVMTALKAVIVYGQIEQLRNEAKSIDRMKKAEWEGYKVTKEVKKRISRVRMKDTLGEEAATLEFELFENIHLGYTSRATSLERKEIIEYFRQAPVVRELLPHYRHPLGQVNPGSIGSTNEFFFHYLSQRKTESSATRSE